MLKYCEEIVNVFKSQSLGRSAHKGQRTVLDSPGIGVKVLNYLSTWYSHSSLVL